MSPSARARHRSGGFISAKSAIFAGTAIAQGKLLRATTVRGLLKPCNRKGVKSPLPGHRAAIPAQVVGRNGGRWRHLTPKGQRETRKGNSLGQGSLPWGADAPGPAPPEHTPQRAHPRANHTCCWHLQHNLGCIQMAAWHGEHDTSAADGM